MNVSRQTFGRVLAEARESVAEALVMGKRIRIHGGAYVLPGLTPNGGAVEENVVAAAEMAETVLNRNMKGGERYAGFR